MLVWSTILPLKPDTTLDKIYGVFKLWLEGSPHSQLKRGNVLPASIPEGVKHYALNEESVDVFRIETALGLRYVKVEGEQTWRTELAFRCSKEIVAAIIRVYVDVRALTYKKPSAKAPYIVRQLVGICGCVDDGPFKYSPYAEQLKFGDAKTLAELITGRGRTLIPVIYLRLSCEWTRKEISLFEKWIGGRAHLVYSSGISFDKMVTKYTGHPPYPVGSATVFIPQADHPVTLPLHQFSSVSRLMARAVVLVRDATLSALGSLGLCLDAIQAESGRVQYAKLRDEFVQKSEENRKFVDYADGEIAAKEERISELEGRIRYLESEVNRYAAKEGADMSIPFTLTDNRPYYAEELRDAILYTLGKGIRNINPNGRYATLIDDLLKSNSISDFEEKIKDALRDVLRGNTHIQHGDFACLERLGFVYKTGNKHHQILFHGDERLMFTVGKTPSDYRAGDNNISDISKKLFQ